MELWHALGLDRDSRSRSRRRTRFPVFFLLLEIELHNPLFTSGPMVSVEEAIPVTPTPSQTPPLPNNSPSVPQPSRPRSQSAGRLQHPRPRSPDRGRPCSPDRGRPRSPHSHPRSPPVLSAQRVQEINNERARRGLPARRAAQLRRNARRPPPCGSASQPVVHFRVEALHTTVTSCFRQL